MEWCQTVIGSNQGINGLKQCQSVIQLLTKEKLGLVEDLKQANAKKAGLEHEVLELRRLVKNQPGVDDLEEALEVANEKIELQKKKLEEHREKTSKMKSLTQRKLKHMKAENAKLGLQIGNFEREELKSKLAIEELQSKVEYLEERNETLTKKAKKLEKVSDGMQKGQRLNGEKLIALQTEVEEWEKNLRETFGNKFEGKKMNDMIEHIRNANFDTTHNENKESISKSRN